MKPPLPDESSFKKNPRIKEIVEKKRISLLYKRFFFSVFILKIMLILKNT
tara:strand:+ start:236 stop:385 length:150 start_codon:yes stop_codon:yes gene_type:complete